MAHTRRAALLALATALLLAAMPGSAAGAVDQQERLVSVTQRVLGARFRIGAEGPDRFDCSGFVWWTFSTAGLGDRIGGKRMRAREYQKWFRLRGLLKTNPKDARVGDLVFYGSPAKHAGIVTRIDSKGRPRVTSTLTTTGVTETKYNSLSVRFHSFAHVGLSVVPDPSPDPTPRPTPTPTPSPTQTPSPTVEPTPAPTPEPTIEPATPAPTEMPPLEPTPAP